MAASEVSSGQTKFYQYFCCSIYLIIYPFNYLFWAYIFKGISLANFLCRWVTLWSVLQNSLEFYLTGRYLFLLWFFKILTRKYISYDATSELFYFKSVKFNVSFFMSFSSSCMSIYQSNSFICKLHSITVQYYYNIIVWIIFIKYIKIQA